MVKKGWSLLRPPLSETRRSIIVLAGLSVLEAVPTLLSGWFIALAIDRGFLARQPFTGLVSLAAYGLIMLGGAYIGRQTVPLSGRVVEAVRDSLIRHVVNGSLRLAMITTELDTALVARITRQTEQARQITGGLISAVRHVLFTTGAAVVGLMTIAPHAAIAVIPALAASGLGFFWLLRALRPRQRALLAAEEGVSSSTGATLSGMRDVIATGGVTRSAAEIERRLIHQATVARGLAHVSAHGALVTAVATRIPLILIVMAAPALVEGGTFTAGQVLGVVTYFISGLDPAIRMLVHVVGQMGLQLGIVLERLAQYGSPPPAPRPDGLTCTGFDIRLDGVTFAHGPDSAPLLRDVTLDIRHGDHLAIVGPSGSGKSTLSDILAGLTKPQYGQVLLGGVDVNAVDETWLREAVTVVPQEAYVFSGTLRENLVYLSPQANHAEMIEAVAAIGLTALVERLGGPETLLDHQAMQSSGERQLIALARAYLSPAQIVILDEATCHLDPVLEARTEQAFAAQGRTLIVIAHRISSVMRAHHIVLLNDGAVATGDHEFLLSRSPLYAEMVDLWSVSSAKTWSRPRSAVEGVAR